jgi:uncharacterized phage-like protein YoqJ
MPAADFSSDRKHTVCITGHREKNILPYGGNSLYREITVSTVKTLLFRYIDMAVEKGYTDFFSGLAMGTDLWAAEYILKKRCVNKKVRLIGVMPYLRHAEGFSREYIRLLGIVENEADVLLTVNEKHDIVYRSIKSDEEAFNLYRNRNYYMVDGSDAVIAFLNRGCFASGTSQTVNYANRRGRKVCRFGIEDVYGIIDKAGPDIRLIGREIQFLDNAFDLPY